MNIEPISARYAHLHVIFSMENNILLPKIFIPLIKCAGKGTSAVLSEVRGPPAPVTRNHAHHVMDIVMPSIRRNKTNKLYYNLDHCLGSSTARTRYIIACLSICRLDSADIPEALIQREQTLLLFVNGWHPQ